MYYVSKKDKKRRYVVKHIPLIETFAVYQITYCIVLIFNYL